MYDFLNRILNKSKLWKKIKRQLVLNQDKLWGWVGNHEQRLNRLEERIKVLEKIHSKEL